MDKEENNKHQIRLERHKWPDEINREKKKKKVIIATASAVVIAFLLGWQGNRLLNSIIGNGKNSEALALFERVYSDVRSSWFFVNDMEDPDKTLVENAIKGMLQRNGDQHTVYMTDEETKKLNDSINMSFVGIGVTYMEASDTNMVTNVIQGSPAEAGGILAGDVISKVDGVSTFSSDIPIKEMIQGEAGQPIEMEVLRAGKPVTLEVIRGRVEALAFGEVLEPGVGYIEMKSFGRGLADVTESILKDFKAKGVKNLVIDLRDNGGGYLDAIQDVARLFLDEGAIVYQEHFTNGKTETYTVKNSVALNYKFDDITILINEGTASASEVLTLALTENLGAKTVGMKSYGKGTVQTQRIYGDSSNLKITIAEWRSPSDISINNVGILPDHEVKLPDVFYASYPLIGTSEFAYDTVSIAASYAQHALTYLGYHNGRTDGYYDSATRDAILAYANAETINTDGTINQALLQRMYSSVLYSWNGNRAVDDIQLIKALEVAKHGS